MKVERRVEDRRSCHHVSFILGLAVAAGNHNAAVQTFEVMLMLVTPMQGQKPN